MTVNSSEARNTHYLIRLIREWIIQRWWRTRTVTSPHSDHHGKAITQHFTCLLGSNGWFRTSPKPINTQLKQFFSIIKHFGKISNIRFISPFKKTTTALGPWIQDSSPRSYCFVREGFIHQRLPNEPSHIWWTCIWMNKWCSLKNSYG